MDHLLFFAAYWTGGIIFANAIRHVYVYIRISCLFMGVDIKLGVKMCAPENFGKVQ